MVINNNQSYFNDELHRENIARRRNRVVGNRWIGQSISGPNIDIAKFMTGITSPGRESASVRSRRSGLEAAMKKGAEVLVSGRRLPHRRPRSAGRGAQPRLDGPAQHLTVFADRTTTKGSRRGAAFHLSGAASCYGSPLFENNGYSPFLLPKRFFTRTGFHFARKRFNGLRTPRAENQRAEDDHQLDDNIERSIGSWPKGYNNRSEAIRDLVRDSLLRMQRDEHLTQDCVAAVSYVYDYDGRDLACGSTGLPLNITISPSPPCAPGSITAIAWR